MRLGSTSHSSPSCADKNQCDKAGLPRCERGQGRGPTGRRYRRDRHRFLWRPLNKLCSADYSSADGTHGFVVVKAEWTPDERYFVFSTQSSGGHQPWHAPTSFYSSDDHMLCSLDDFLEPPGIATPDFMLSPPNRITTFIYGKPTPASTLLDPIRKTGTRNGTPRCVPCDRAHVYRFGWTTE